MNIQVLDTRTGETHWFHNIEPFDAFDGNWSCDCNRNFTDDEGPENICAGAHRFLIVKTEGECEYTLEELNEEYPREMLIEHGILIPQ